MTGDSLVHLLTHVGSRWASREGSLDKEAERTETDTLRVKEYFLGKGGNLPRQVDLPTGIPLDLRRGDLDGCTRCVLSGRQKGVK